MDIVSSLDIPFNPTLFSWLFKKYVQIKTERTHTVSNIFRPCYPDGAAVEMIHNEIRQYYMKNGSRQTEYNRRIDNSLGLKIVRSRLKKRIQIKRRNQRPYVISSLINKGRIYVNI